MKVIGFKTYKCSQCGNVMRHEYNPKGEHKPCCVCRNTKWIEITMNEV